MISCHFCLSAHRNSLLPVFPRKLRDLIWTLAIAIAIEFAAFAPFPFPQPCSIRQRIISLERLWYYYECAWFTYLAPPSFNVKTTTTIISIDCQFKRLNSHNSGRRKRKKLKVAVLTVEVKKISATTEANLTWTR